MASREVRQPFCVLRFRLFGMWWTVPAQRGLGRLVPRQWLELQTRGILFTVSLWKRLHYLVGSTRRFALLETAVNLAPQGYFIIGTWTNWRTPEEMATGSENVMCANDPSILISPRILTAGSYHELLLRRTWSLHVLYTDCWVHAYQA